LGWISKAEKAQIEPRLRALKSNSEGLSKSNDLRGRIDYIESFEWANGGGLCFRGTLEIVS